MTPAIDASSWKATAERGLGLWEYKCAAFRLSRLCPGQTLTIEKTKFSSFCQRGAQAEGLGLLLWGQVEVVQIARADDNHSSQTQQQLSTV